MEIFDIVQFMNDDYLIERGVIVGVKQVPLQDVIQLRSNSFTDSIFQRTKLIYTIKTSDRLYDREEYSVKKIDLKSISEYSTKELTNELMLRKDVEFMKNGNVITLILK